MMTLAVLLLSSALWLVFSGPALATAGQLDPSFGPNGLLFRNELVQGPQLLTGVVPESDGGEVAWVVQGTQTADTSIRLKRFDTNGQLDATFGAGGEAVVHLGSTEGSYLSNVSDVSQAPDGKLVVGLDSTDANSGAITIRVARITQTGAADASFGRSGVATVPFPQPYTTTYAAAFASLAVDGDGKILLAGGDIDRSSAPLRSYGWWTIRLNGDGTLDTSFSGDGYTHYTMPGPVHGPRGIESSGSRTLVRARATDHKVVLGGCFFRDGRWRPALLRLTAAGNPDAGFTTGGYVGLSEQDFGNSSSCITDFRFAPADGKLVATAADYAAEPSAGQAVTDSEPLTTLGVARVRDDGQPDSTFGTGGPTRLSISGSDTGQTTFSAQSIAVLADSRVVVEGAGSVGAGFTSDTGSATIQTVARLTTSGALDQSFGAGGRTINTYGNACDLSDVAPADLGVLPDGDLTSSVWDATPAHPATRFAFVRYLGDRPASGLPSGNTADCPRDGTTPPPPNPPPPAPHNGGTGAVPQPTPTAEAPPQGGGQPSASPGTALLNGATKALNVGIGGFFAFTFGASCFGGATAGEALSAGLDTPGLFVVCPATLEAAVATGIALADPPDPHYSTVFRLHPFTTGRLGRRCKRLTPRPCARLHVAVKRYVRSLADTASVTEALAVTLNRYSGALLAKDQGAATIQRAAALNYLSRQTVVFGLQRQAGHRLAALLRRYHLNAVYSARNLAAARLALAKGRGIPPAVLARMKRNGLIRNKADLTHALSELIGHLGKARRVTLIGELTSR